MNIVDYYGTAKLALIGLLAVGWQEKRIAHVAWQQACAGRN